MAAFERIWLEQLLAAGEEKLLWMGRPAKLYRYDGTVSVLLAALIWFPFVFPLIESYFQPQGWETRWEEVFLHGTALTFSFFLVLFPCWKWYKAKHTVCVLTEKRAIIQAPTIWGRPGYRMYPLEANMIRDRRRDGRGKGSIIFDYGLTYVGGIRMLSWPIGFLHIDEVERVEQLMFHELFYRHGEEPEMVPERTLQQMAHAVLRQLVMGVLAGVAGAALWFSCDTLPKGWIEERVMLSYPRAEHGTESDGTFLWRGGDGCYYRVPLFGTRDKYSDGDSVLIAYPADNPLQARLAPTARGQQMAAVILVAAGIFLFLQGMLYYCQERKKRHRTDG